MGFINQELSKKDFLKNLEVSITVHSETLIEQKRSKERIAMTNVFSLTQTMELPKASKNLFLRDFMVVNDIPQIKADRYAPLTP